MAMNVRMITRLWMALGVVTVLALLFPIGFGALRTLIVIALPLFWLGALMLSWRSKWLFAIVALIGLLAVLLVTLPGREVEPTALRGLYVVHLREYEGTRYIFGGENKIGIDCSGLVRLALVDANFRHGLLRFNPAAVRQALSIWLNDASALALSTGYRDLTQYITSAASIQALDHSLLQPGDLAVTQDGQHVLAYLGDATWIQAEPQAMRVVINKAADSNIWLSVPINVVRWTQLSAQ